MTVQIIQFPGAFKTQSERMVEALLEKLERILADPKTDKERALAAKLRARTERAPMKL